MNDPMLEVQIDGAEAYERLMVPALFSTWAPKVCSVAQVGPGHRVLDVGCGTGVLAREARRRVGGGGLVSGVDPNPGMLEVARRLSPDVDWHQGTAESLPFPEKSFDAVLSQFALMFFSDPRRSLQETARVLKPGGHYAIAVWNSLESNPAYAAEIDVVRAIAGERAADPIRVPFQMGDAELLRDLFRDAGIGGAEVMTVHDTGRFPSVEAMVEADVRGWLPVVGVLLSESEIRDILAECKRQLAEYVTAQGSVAFPTSALIVYGVAQT